MKAKLLTDKICPDFLYTVVEIDGDMITLGWCGRWGIWNETGWLPITDVLLVEDKVEST